jgi:hypothetical protein
MFMPVENILNVKKSKEKIDAYISKYYMSMPKKINKCLMKSFTRYFLFLHTTQKILDFHEMTLSTHRSSRYTYNVFYQNF